MARLAVVGELDLATAPELGEAVGAALEAGVPEVLLDLTPTSFIDSTGLSALMQAQSRCRAAGRLLRIHAPAGSEARVVVQLAGLDSQLGLK